MAPGRDDRGAHNAPKKKKVKNIVLNHNQICIPNKFHWETILSPQWYSLQPKTNAYATMVLL